MTDTRSDHKSDQRRLTCAENVFLQTKAHMRAINASENNRKNNVQFYHEQQCRLFSNETTATRCRPTRNN